MTKIVSQKLNTEKSESKNGSQQIPEKESAGQDTSYLALLKKIAEKGIPIPLMLYEANSK